MVIFVNENTFENAVYEVLAIFAKLQCSDWFAVAFGVIFTAENIVITINNVDI